jgi:hypothetical protein
MSRLKVVDENQVISVFQVPVVVGSWWGKATVSVSSNRQRSIRPPVVTLFLLIADCGWFCIQRVARLP